MIGHTNGTTGWPYRATDLERLVRRLALRPQPDVVHVLEDVTPIEQDARGQLFGAQRRLCGSR